MALGRFQLRLCALIALLCPAMVGAQESHVSLEISERGVTLNARNSTVREVLDEWARVGGIRILNGEKLDQRRVTLDLSDVTEREAFEVLLRDVGGYVLSARGIDDHGRSQFGSLLVVPAGTTLFGDGNSAPSRASLAASQPVVPNERDQELDPQLFVLGGSGISAPRAQAGAALAGSDVTGGGLSRDVPPASPTALNVPEGLVGGAWASTATPPELRPPTPLSRPSEAPDASNPFGKVSGSAKPGTIVPGGPPAGVWYPPVTEQGRTTAPR